MCVYIFSTDGQTVMTAQIPDTITSWVLSAFAVSSETGLGVAAERAEVNIAVISVTVWLITRSYKVNYFFSFSEL